MRLLKYLTPRYWIERAGYIKVPPYREVFAGLMDYETGTRFGFSVQSETQSDFTLRHLDVFKFANGEFVLHAIVDILNSPNLLAGVSLQSAADGGETTCLVGRVTTTEEA